MNEKTDKAKNNEESEDRSPKAGALLRATRLRLDEDLKDVAEMLRIRYPYLEAIEECRYGDLPGDTYAIGFIRSYAEHMGLDGEEIVRRFRAEQAGNKRSNDLAFPTPVPESGMPRAAIVFIGVLLAMAVYGGWYVSTTDEGLFSDLISPVPDHLQHLVDDADKTTDQPQTATTETAETAAVPQPAAPTEVSDGAETAATENATAGQTVEQATDQAAGQAVEKTAETVSKQAPDAAAVADTTSTTTATATDEAADQTKAKIEDAAQEITRAATDAPAAVETTTEATAAQVNETATPAPAATETQAQTVEAAGEDAVVSVQEAAETLVDEGQTPQGPESPAPATTVERVTADDLNAQSLQRVTGTPEATTTPQTETVQAPVTAPAASTAAPTSRTTETANVPLSGIVIHAVDSSWVEIRDPSGKIVFTGLMAAGQRYAVPGIGGLVLATGNAGALDISVDGTSVPKLGGVGIVRKGVVLDAERLKAGTATSQ